MEGCSALAGGMFPSASVVDTSRKSGGVQMCIDAAYIQHSSGEKHHGAPIVSKLLFKSYDQGRDAFQGKAINIIWLDEEPPDPPRNSTGETGDIYTECTTRLLTTRGLLMCTWTPLRGYTPFITEYIKTARMLHPRTGMELPAPEVLAEAEQRHTYVPGTSD